MMNGIKSSAAVALFATAARAAEEVVQQVAEQAPEAAKEILTNENAAGYLSSALNAVSHCPSFVSETLTAVVGENPYARAAVSALTVAAAVGIPALVFSNRGKKSAATTKNVPESKDSKIVANPTTSPKGTPQQSSSESSVGDKEINADADHSVEHQEGEKSRSRSPSPSRKGD